MDIKFPEDIVLIKKDDNIKCMFCNGEGKWHEYDICSVCSGKGTLVNKKDARKCSRCNGSGYFHSEKGLKCFTCSGKGVIIPMCKNCGGLGKINKRLILCEKCRGSSYINICKAAANFAEIEYIHRIARIMAHCAEEIMENDGDTELFKHRGENLYYVMREIYKYTKRDCPKRVEDIFPESLNTLIRVSWKSICKT